MARPKGIGGKTQERIVALLQDEVKRTSQAATARATGLTLAGVQNYLKGIGEPTTATLQKLADYFGYTVAWLRGEESSATLGGISEFLQTEENQKIALNRIVDVLKIDQEWGKDGLFNRISEKTGLSAAYIERALTGKQRLTENFIEKVAEYLEVSENYLLEGGETPPRVVELLKKKVAADGFDSVVKESRLNPMLIKQYLKGLGEPEDYDLLKLADLFRVTVNYLTGESDFKKYDEELQRKHIALANDAIELFHIAPERLKWSAQELIVGLVIDIESVMHSEDWLEEGELYEHKPYADCLEKLNQILELDIMPPWKTEKPK